MKVIAVSKINTTSLAYGERQQIETLSFDNVSNIAEVTVGVSGTFYQITHKTGADEEAHTTQLPVTDYTIMIV